MGTVTMGVTEGMMGVINGATTGRAVAVIAVAGELGVNARPTAKSAERSDKSVGETVAVADNRAGVPGAAANYDPGAGN